MTNHLFIALTSPERTDIFSVRNGTKSLIDAWTSGMLSVSVLKFDKSKDVGGQVFCVPNEE